MDEDRKAALDGFKVASTAQWSIYQIWYANCRLCEMLFEGDTQAEVTDKIIAHARNLHGFVPTII